MVRKTGLLVVIVLLCFASFSSPTAAQSPTPDENIIATGLNSPRNMTYGSDGTLYVAEAGKGGDQSGIGPYGPVNANPKTGVGIGQTGQITAISPDGKKSVVIGNLVSTNIGLDQVYGAMAVHVTDDSYWVALGLGPTQIPKGTNIDAVVQYSRKDLSVKQVIDFGDFEKKNNPDQNPDDLVSNPSDIAVADDGTIYVPDASGNDLLSWTQKDGLRVFASWPTDATQIASVPTSVALGTNGDIYVSFLTGFPFQPGNSRIEVYGHDATLKKTYPNLSFVTDLLVAPDGTIYAVEFSNGYGDQGWVPNSGSVVKVSDDGLTLIAQNLNFPYGIAMSPEGRLVVSVDSFGVAPDSGRIIALDTGASSS